MGGRVLNRTFVIEDAGQRDRLGQFLAKHQLPFQVDVGSIREQRSLSQNSRLWALHQMASEQTGYSPNEMHEYALCRHFGYEEKKCGGVIRMVPTKRSSTRDKDEFRQFLEATETWYAQDFGVWLGMEEMA
jgi:hypothetical protein